MLKVCVIGLGHVGLPTAILLAQHKVRVYGVDIQKVIVDKINAVKAHIVEPDLQTILEEAVQSGYLSAHTQVQAADIFIIAVPTPIDSKHCPVISHIKAAAESMAPVLSKGNLIILESTSPVGTTEKLEQWLSSLRPDLTFPKSAGNAANIQLCYCPERVLPGNSMYELVHNERIIGGLTDKATQKACAFFEIFVKGHLHTSTARMAELAKLVENSFRDANIAFANEIALICHKLGIDCAELINLANKHPRVHILQPSSGVGGHCIPVDPWFLVHCAPHEAQLIHCARKINDERPLWIAEHIKKRIWHILTKNPHKSMAEFTVACLGLGYKANSKDIRNSPAVNIVQSIAGLGCQVQVVSNYVEKLPFNADNVYFCHLDTALSTADIICVLVEDENFVKAKERIGKHGNVIYAANLTL